MERSPHAGPAAPASPATPDVLYDRDVRTRVYRLDSQSIRVVATLKDDTYGPGGFSSVHDMVLAVTIDEPTMTITTVSAEMLGHPHRACPTTLRQMDQLVGLQIGRGYFRELRDRFGGNRGCNHLHTMAQHIGTVTALSFAARLVEGDLDAQALPHDRWLLNVVQNAPHIVNSCAIWHEDGELAARMRSQDS